jgi:hypothetical protein
MARLNSYAKRTGVTEKGQIWKKLLAEFISRNMIKKGPKYIKKISLVRKETSVLGLSLQDQLLKLWSFHNKPLVE